MQKLEVHARHLFHLYCSCFCVISAVMTHHNQKELKKGRTCLVYTSTIVYHPRKSGQELTQGRNLKAGADAEAMEECCFLTYSSWLSQLTFL